MAKMSRKEWMDHVNELVLAMERHAGDRDEYWRAFESMSSAVPHAPYPETDKQKAYEAYLEEKWALQKAHNKLKSFVTCILMP